MLYSASKGKGKGKLSLGKYPYTYARVSVMRSLLIRKEEYQKLMKMNVIEITSYLQGSQYRKEIDELAVKFKGLELMELALNRNLANTWAKLKRISPRNLRALISAYLLRVDIWNVKTILRAKYTKLEHEKLQAMLLPSGGFLSEKAIGELSRKETVEDVLKSVGFVNFAYFGKALEEFRESKSLTGVENSLDIFYNSAMGELAGRIPKGGKLFREFIEYELEISAIINVLRLKRAGIASKDIAKYIVAPQSICSLITKMAQAGSASDASKLLESSAKLKQFVENGVKEFVASGSLVRLELDLYKSLLRRSALLMHQHPLTVEVILGYMLAKEIEVRNLKLLLKSRQLSMPADFAESQLVTI